MQTTGVQLPTPAYNLLESYAISAAYYLAISFVLIIVVFPQTLNHEWLQDAGNLIGAATALVELQEQVLASNPASLNSLLTEKLQSRADVLAKLSHACKCLYFIGLANTDEISSENKDSSPAHRIQLWTIRPC